MRREYVNVTYSIIILWSEGSISSSLRCSYLSTSLDDRAEIFAASLLISYCNFSTVKLLLVVNSSFDILSKRFFLKHKGLFDARVASLTKKEYGFALHY